MSKFVKLSNVYVNTSIITDFFYDEEHNMTKVGMLGEDSYRRFIGNWIDKLLEALNQEM